MAKKITIYVIIALMATGCSKQERPDPTPPYQVSDTPIMISANASGVIESSGESRTAFPSIPSGGTASLMTAVAASLNGTNFVTLMNGATLNTNLVTLAACAPGEQAQASPAGYATPIFYPLDRTTPVWLVGLYPTDQNWTASGGSEYGRPIPGFADIMTSVKVSTTKSDALSAPTTYKNMVFKHRLTLLDVQIVGSSTSAAAWGVVQYLSLTKVQGAVPNARFILNLSTDATRFSGTPTGNFIPFNVNGVNTPFNGQSIPITTTATSIAYGIFQPITVANVGDVGYSILVKTAETFVIGMEVPITMNSTGSTEGKKITVLITFGPQRQIQATATVSDWGTGINGSGSANM